MPRMNRQLITILTLIVLTNCSQQKEPKIFEGIADIIVTDGVTNDTLDICYCWRTADSLGIIISRGPSFAGIAIEIGNKMGRHSSTVKYWLDSNQFNGENELTTKLTKDNLSIRYENIGDSVLVSGQINFETDVVDFFKDNRKVKADGTFSCNLNK